MFQGRCKQGGLFLTADLLVEDDGGDEASADCDLSALKKMQYFQPIEDLLTALDNIAASTVAT